MTDAKLTDVRDGFKTGLKQFHFAAGRTDDAIALVLAHHYSGRAPSNIQAVGTLHADGGLFGDRGDAVAACMFSIPPTRWAEPVLELSRLVRAPDCEVYLTSLIAETVQHVKRKGLADLVISFADWTHDHHGGIYQASSWNYAGQRDRNMDGVEIDGVFVPGRSANSRFGARSPAKLREQMDDRHVIEPHFDEGKHLYWRALTRDGRKQAVRAGLAMLPYPKPGTPS